MQKNYPKRAGDFILSAGIWLTITAEFLALAALSYLGTFTRFLADDYCEVVIIRNSSIFTSIFQNYMLGGYRAANRFSNLLFVGLGEALGRYNVQFLPALMILIWLVGLTWTINQARRLAGIRLPVMVDCFVAAALVFFSAIQAPNRFQTFFWRSSVATHFAPLVFMFLLSGFILFHVRSAKDYQPKPWVLLTVFIMSFLIGGFSEPSNTFMFVVIALLLLYTWRWASDLWKRSALNLLLFSLLGTFLALCALFFAPGNLLHGIVSVSRLLAALGQTIQFSFDFIWDTFLTLPLPTLISALISGLLFFCLYISADKQPLAHDQKRYIWIWLILAPVLHFLLIAASFAPSAYGQDYPVERARFLGRFLMTSALIFEGALLGVWFAQFKQLFAFRNLVLPIAGVALIVLGIYPLRAVFSMLSEIESYKSWAFAWDAREANIRAE